MSVLVASGMQEGLDHEFRKILIVKDTHTWCIFRFEGKITRGLYFDLPPDVKYIFAFYRSFFLRADT